MMNVCKLQGNKVQGTNFEFRGNCCVALTFFLLLCAVVVFAAGSTCLHPILWFGLPLILTFGAFAAEVEGIRLYELDEHRHSSKTA